MPDPARTATHVICHSLARRLVVTSTAVPSSLPLSSLPVFTRPGHPLSVMPGPSVSHLHKLVARNWKIYSKDPGSPVTVRLSNRRPQRPLYRRRLSRSSLTKRASSLRLHACPSLDSLSIPSPISASSSPAATTPLSAHSPPPRRPPQSRFALPTRFLARLEQLANSLHEHHLPRL